MVRAVRLCLLSLLVLLAVPVAANAATVTVANGTITYTAGAGETNTAVIVKQQTTPVATVYFVGDQNPNVTVTASAAQGCLPTPPAVGLPEGYLCTVSLVTPVTSLVENLGDGNDTGVISAAGGPAGRINGSTGADTLVGAQENDTFSGGTGTDSVAYVGISAASISRTSPVNATLPTGASSTGNGQAGENDTINADVEGLTGGNGNDTLTGNGGANTIAGSPPPGTPDVNPQPPGTESRDTINGGGGNDTLLAGDSGAVNGGDGNDTIVGGRSFANTTFVNGATGDDTLVSGIGTDNFAGGGGSDTLAYVSVSQSGLQIVNRGVGVQVQLPEPGTLGSGGAIGGQEHDVIHDDIRTLIGSNNGDFLVGSNGVDTILGAAPVGTGNGVIDTPAGNDTILGRGGDDSLVGGDRGQINGGDGNDTIVGGRSAAASNSTVIHGAAGDDTLVSGPGNDEVFGDAGSNTLAYVSVQQQGINIVSRSTGVLVQLPEPGAAGSGGAIGGQEHDVIHDDIRTLIGSNGADGLTGSNVADTILGAAPVGTGNGVIDTPAGNDTILGRGGDDSLVGGDRGQINGGDGNDTIVGGRSAAASNSTVIHGAAGDDTLVSGPGNDEVFGDAGSNTLAYVSVQQQGINIVSRSTGVLVQLPEPGAAGSGGAIGGQEHDVIHDDIRTLIGSNNGDFLVGSNGVDTIVGAAPVGTGNGVSDTPAGNDAIYGRGGNDTLVGGDRGYMYGGDGDDSIVGGRSTAASNRTVIHGDLGNDTIVSGLGNDEVFGDAGSNTLAYASVQQQGLDIVDRGTNGVTATLPNAGLTTTGGKTGGPEKDIIHSDIGTLVGGNGNDVLVGNDVANQIVGVAPAGTAGVKPGPAGNDISVGFGGNDLVLGAEGNDFQFGGGGNDVLVSGAGNDWLVGESGVDVLNAGDGNDTNLARDGVVDTISCGPGIDSLDADAIDIRLDCETISAAQ